MFKIDIITILSFGVQFFFTILKFKLLLLRFFYTSKLKLGIF
jgi:hypothetical protein